MDHGRRETMKMKRLEPGDDLIAHLGRKKQEPLFPETPSQFRVAASVAILVADIVSAGIRDKNLLSFIEKEGLDTVVKNHIFGLWNTPVISEIVPRSLGINILERAIELLERDEYIWNAIQETI